MQGEMADNCAFCSPSRFPSSFTAVNSPPSAQPTILIPSSTAPNSSVPRSRRHNPAVAGYLGLGNETDYIRTERSSPSASAPGGAQPLKPKRQRVKKTQDASNDVPARPTKKKTTKRAPKATKQRLISHELPVRKTSGLLTLRETPKHSFENGDVSTKAGDDLTTYSIDVVDYESSSTLEGVPYTDSPPQQQPYPGSLADISEASTGQSSSSAAQIDHSTNNKRLTSNPLQPNQKATLQIHNEDEDDDFIDDDLDDEALLILSEVVERSLHTQQDTIGRNTTAITNVSSATTRAIATRPCSQYISPATPLASLVSKLDMKPIVRPPFPDQVRDRSPVVGLTPNCLLRTCFRVGEAINASRHAMRNGKNVMVELYARVLRSHRDDTKQYFVLCDLFHRNPPFLRAEYDAAIWRSVPLYEIDSRVFLGEGKSADESKVCRCILTTKNCGNKEWVATMLNIWPAKKEDIQWVEGIVNS